MAVVRLLESKFCERKLFFFSFSEFVSMPSPFHNRVLLAATVLLLSQVRRLSRFFFFGAARQSSRLSTYIPSAEDGENNGENFSEICAKKELDGKAGLRKEGASRIAC